jgi:mono/diheme cytochrome c family protein
MELCDGMRGGTVIPIAFGVMALAGCGGGYGSPKCTGGSTSAQTRTAIRGELGSLAVGKAVFADECGGCHSLKAAGAAAAAPNGAIGPSLDECKPSIELVVERVRKDKGAMPSLKELLTPFEIKSVAAYVYASTHAP